MTRLDIERSLGRVMCGIVVWIRAGENAARSLGEKFPDDRKFYLEHEGSKRYAFRLAFHEAWRERREVMR